MIPQAYTYKHKLALLQMLSSLDFEQMAYIVGYVTVKDTELVTKALSSLQVTDIGGEE